MSLFKKLSAYTVASNCSDESDILAGISELREYFKKCESDNIRIANSAYIRFYKLNVKLEKTRNHGMDKIV